MNTDKNYRMLACAIVEKAVEDWQILNKPPVTEANRKEIESIERFFRSDWCFSLCGINGTTIIANLKRKAACGQ